MTTALIIGVDLVAIAILVFGLYFPRHRRRDLVVAFVGVNVGVLAVSMVLASSSVGLGLGLGLFGVLSIIRLRSTEITQVEVAYYFAALAIGLVSGLATTIEPLMVVLVGIIVAAMFAVDHPRLLARARVQSVKLDSALPREQDARDAVEALLGVPVQRIAVLAVDQVDDTTLVEVRYRVPRTEQTRADRPDPERRDAPAELTGTAGR